MEIVRTGNDYAMETCDASCDYLCLNDCGDGFN